MNCEKFENRVQQLLDSRSSLTLDLEIQKHARECQTCHSALTIYECFDDIGSAAKSDGHCPESVILASRPATTTTAWQDRQRSTTRNRLIVSVAALVFLASFLVNRQTVTTPSVAAIKEQPEFTAAHQIKAPATASMLSHSLEHLNGMLDYVVPDDLSQISPGNYIDISSLENIDLVALMPEHQVRAVRNLPATFESMHPIYRYTSELPVLQNWSNGINCTLGVIQSSLSPVPRQKSLVVPAAGNELGGNGLGIRPLIDNRHTC